MNKPELSAAAFAEKHGYPKIKVLRMCERGDLIGAYIGCCGAWHIPADAKPVEPPRGNPNFIKKNRP